MQDYEGIKQMLDNLVNEEDNVQIDVDISYATAKQIALVRHIMSEDYPEWTEVSDFYEQEILVFRKDYDPDEREDDYEDFEIS